VVDRQAVTFVISAGATIPFCCQACFARSCQRQMQRHQAQSTMDPLARLGYDPKEAW
jgi:hypothetical protein